MALYAITRQDGGVSIMNTSVVVKGETIEFPFDVCIDKWNSGQKDGEKYVSHREITENDLPKSRAFRDAWTDENPEDFVGVNMEKARHIKMAEIREKRNKKLEELDVVTLRGIDNQAEKQVLRDLPDVVAEKIGQLDLEALEAYERDELK